MMETPRAYRQGDHICVVYDTADEQLRVAVSYIADGLSCRERCLYAADSEDALERFRSALAEQGIDVPGAIFNGALLLLTKETAHLVNGYFDCERMLRMLNEGVEAALNAGFAGLRTCGDMSWLLDQASGSHQVVEYESLLNQFFRNVRGLGMCQYDRARLPAPLLHHALATHSSAVVSERHTANPFYTPAALEQHIVGSADDLERKLRQLRHQ